LSQHDGQKAEVVVEEERLQRRPLEISAFTRLSGAPAGEYVKLKEEESDPRFGFQPNSRPLPQYLDYGFIVLDKPQGPTSHQVAAWVRKIFNKERAGYSGTLDPPVSGILPVALGDGTKALTSLLLGPKEYVAVARIHDSVPEDVIRRTIGMFTGVIYQKPPQRSSVKRATRTRAIYELEIIEKAGNLLLLRVLCEAGTYVRKLIYDFGEIIVVGATMAELRRTRVCQFTEKDLVTLQNLYEAKAVSDETGNEEMLRKVVRPVEESVSFLPEIRIRDSAIESICQGAKLAVPGILGFSGSIRKTDVVRVMSGKGELVAIAEAQMDAEEIRKSEHGIAAITKRVIMKQGTYPKMWKSRSTPDDTDAELLARSLESRTLT
jgi:H/ACA ribonucleoprotein complex subunit 4